MKSIFILLCLSTCVLSDPNQLKSDSIIITLGISSAALSFIGSLYVAYLHFGNILLKTSLLKKCTKYVSSKKDERVNLIGWLAVSDMFLSVFWIVSFIESECSFSGVFRLYFYWSSTLWSTVISLNILVTLDEEKYAFLKIFRKKIIQHLITWLVPMIILIMAFALEISGPDVYWCWIDRDLMFYRVFMFDVPIGILMILNVSFYVLISYTFREKVKNSANEVQVLSYF
jgi:hypothetical protein